MLLAIGRRGTPRKLGVPGEELPKVVYRLVDPEQYVGPATCSWSVAATARSKPQRALPRTARVGDAVLSRRCVLAREAEESRAHCGRRESGPAQGALQVGSAAHRAAIEWCSTSDGRDIDLPNDAVIVSAGGILPVGLPARHRRRSGDQVWDGVIACMARRALLCLRRCSTCASGSSRRRSRRRRRAVRERRPTPSSPPRRQFASRTTRPLLSCCRSRRLATTPRRSTCSARWCSRTSFRRRTGRGHSQLFESAAGQGTAEGGLCAGGDACNGRPAGSRGREALAGAGRGTSAIQWRATCCSVACCRSRHARRICSRTRRRGGLPCGGRRDAATSRRLRRSRLRSV